MYLTSYCNRNDVAARYPFAGLRDSVDSIFHDILGAEGAGAAQAWSPAVDVRETDAAYILTADLPGLDREAIDLAVEEGTLTISGERKQEADSEEDGVRRSERRFGRFQRSFRIRDGFDHTKVEAQYTNGVLRVVLPKRQENQRKRIEVKVT